MYIYNYLNLISYPEEDLGRLLKSNKKGFYLFIIVYILVFFNRVWCIQVFQHRYYQQFQNLYPTEILVYLDNLFQLHHIH